MIASSKTATAAGNKHKADTRRRPPFVDTDQLAVKDVRRTKSMKHFVAGRRALLQETDVLLLHFDSGRGNVNASRRNDDEAGGDRALQKVSRDHGHAASGC